MLLYVDTQFASPYALCAFVALHEKQREFELKTIDLGAQANHEHDYARTSLTERVPTLVDDGFSLSESSAIAEYIDETCAGPSLFPKDIKARARARQVQAWLRSDLMPIRQERSTEVVFYGPVSQPLSAAARASARKLFAVVRTLLAHGGKNLFGDWSIADVDMATMLNRLVLNGDEVPADLVRYAKGQWDRDAVQRWVRLERPPL